MSGFAILDLVIGMIFIFFLLSIICSSAVEVILTLFRVRAGILAKWLREVFNQTALHPTGLPNTGVKLGQAIMDHCMTTVLSGENKSTTYINSSDFVNALLDQITLHQVATPSPASAIQLPPSTLQEYVSAIASSPVISGELKRTILALANEASKTFGVSRQFTQAVTEVKSDIDLFKEKLENWYDSNAERLVGRLKRRWVFPFTVLLATGMTVSLNADTVAMAKYLYDHKEASKALADKAMATYGNYEARVKTITGDSTQKKDSASIAKLKQAADQLKQDVDSMKVMLPADFPIGWPKCKDSLSHKKKEVSANEASTDKDERRSSCEADFGNMFSEHWPGWLATILAILLGAPFWFDLLNKVANLRGTGPKPPSSLTDTKGNTTINS